MKIGFVCADDFLAVNFTRSLARRLEELGRPIGICAVCALDRGFGDEIRAGLKGNPSTLGPVDWRSYDALLTHANFLRQARSSRP